MKIRGDDFLSLLSGYPGCDRSGGLWKNSIQSNFRLPKFGCVNVHASLLPRWRGASPIYSAILAGDPKTGVTIMRMDEGVDTGAILSVKEIPIDQGTRPDH
jgi:methionyl-tRNA formyltransferase